VNRSLIWTMRRVRNPQIPLAETIGALCKMKQGGFARHIGVSNFTVAMLGEAVALATEPLVTNQFEWHYDPTNKNQKYYNKPGDTYSTRPWTGGDKFFSFDYTFTTVGIFDLTASVMCSRDLSGLSGVADDKPTKADWTAWNENIHKLSPYLQGETERYQLAVVASPVPEPKTYGMMIVGLGLIGAVARRRKA